MRCGTTPQVSLLITNIDAVWNDQSILDEAELLKKLSPITHAQYNPAKACLVGTRQRFINDVVTWCQRSAKDANLLWIHGQIGTGKSAIAASVCERLGRQKGTSLAANFFCNRGDPELCDPKLMLQTIVYGLATLHTKYGQAVATALRDHSHRFDSSIQRLYEDLVQKPLKHVADVIPNGILIILVDALDECPAETREELLSCLLAMSQLVPWLKVMINSRPEADIRDFVEKSNVTGVTSFDIRTYDASADIGLLIRRSLCSSTNNETLPQALLAKLSSRANGLFAWAQIACDYILGGLDRTARLHRVLNDGDALNVFLPLDSLHTKFLESTISANRGIGIPTLRLCLGAIVATSARTPLPVSTLGRLLQNHMSPNVLEQIISILRPVLYVNNEDGAGICAHHPSFSEYITSPARSGVFCVDLIRQNAELAGCCLDAMRQGLRFNICSLEKSHILNKDINDLGNRASTMINPALSYSCRHWTSHLCQALMRTSMERGLYDAICQLMFGPMLLYWIEVLSLLGVLSLAPQSLVQLVCSLPVSMVTTYSRH
jgi:hypothetical protein